MTGRRMSGRGSAGSGGSGGRKAGGAKGSKPGTGKPAGRSAAGKTGAAPRSARPTSGKGGRGGEPRAQDSRGRTGKGAGGRAGQSRGTSGRAVGGRSAGGAQRRSEPKGLGGEQVEGRQAVRELLLAGRRRVREVMVVDKGDTSDDYDRFESDDDSDSGDELVELARDLRVLVRPVSRGRLAAIARTEAPQGVVAIADPLEPVELAELAEPGPDGTPAFLVAVDGVTDPGNLGALLRAAECAGATGVILPRHRAVHVTPTVAKAAAGAVEHLPMALVPGLPAALVELSRLGVWSVGLDAGGTTRVWDLTIADEPVVLVLGAEGRGLSRLVSQRCDQLASIPLAGSLASLNVATAAAVACFEVARHRGAASPVTD
jgi:23S rRNA (guanosine2251-2'-O)-methyltransferase